MKSELEVLQFWKEDNTFQKSVSQRTDCPKFVIFEGPPTANGKPGIHHVLTRTFKDIVGRYKTMSGFQVERKAGWDQHGLPVELEIQKNLNLSSKKEIEAFGVDNFIQECHKSTQKYIEEWRTLTERMGYWLDFDNAYQTASPQYISKVWNVLAKIQSRGLITKSSKVVPWAIDSETTVSNAEVAQGYKTVQDQSIYVMLPVDSVTFLVIWTTTPWTLPGNMAVAFNPNLKYVSSFLKEKGCTIIHLESVNLGSENVQPFSSELLSKLQYKHPFVEKYCPLIPANFVKEGQGTGLVHIAPAFGADDAEVFQKNFPDTEIVCHITESGDFISPPEMIGQKLLNQEKNGLSFKKANALIKKLIPNLILKEELYSHEYPHNWRTGAPLIYLARPSWFIKTSELSEQMTQANSQVTWHPEHLKEGRFGNWISNAVDWSISRERYWGTPLPLNQDGSFLMPSAPHKPQADSDHRVSEVADCWLDSGCMPWAAFDSYQQADVICEAIDQTRGWFYSLMAIGTSLGVGSPYKRVLCLGHVLDKDGNKMSKSKGNTVDPVDMFEKYSADAVRFYFASQPIGNSIRFDEAEIKKIHHGLINQINNCIKVFEMHKDKFVRDGSIHPMDIWLTEYLCMVNNQAQNYYSSYQFDKVSDLIKIAWDRVSNVWIRGNRERVGESKGTLIFAFSTLAMMMAPIMPMTAEMVYSLVDTSSVHLQQFIESYSVNHQDYLDEMEKVLKVISSLRDLRTKAKINLKQPVASVSIPDSQFVYFEDFLKAEINCKKINYQSELSLDTNLTQGLLDEGKLREFSRLIQQSRKEAGYHAGDHVIVVYSLVSPNIDFFHQHRPDLEKKLSCSFVGFRELKEPKVKGLVDFQLQSKSIVT